ncbi:uncharacterized protein P884DRAFT_265308 [Thermothelomyces heterothallicus CBS 202.75]|uniref:uncharacterized protein n=1 Tax=Thermothelomyces heterothallicus CBS 202.75 TaxID=1149848 RepID=UPI0037446D85
MGFVAGFAGGVTLTLSLTYLALLTHTSNRQAQSAVLRSQASAIDALIPPEDDHLGRRRRRNATVPLPDGTYRPRESLEQYRRDAAAGGAGPGVSFVETAKTRWNSEILSAVRWAQNKDWSRVREQAEDKVAALFGLELSREPVTVEEVVAVSPPAARQHHYHSDQQHQPQLHPQHQQQAEHEEAVRRARDSLHHARDTTVAVAQAMRDEAREIVSEAREVVAAGVHEAKGAVGKGVEKAHDLVERTKAAVHLAEERAESEAYAKMLPVSDIEKALAERYDSARREERMKRSVEEVLRERYLPLDKRDNSRLRGL